VEPANSACVDVRPARRAGGRRFRSRCHSRRALPVVMLHRVDGLLLAPAAMSSRRDDRLTDRLGREGRSPSPAALGNSRGRQLDAPQQTHFLECRSTDPSSTPCVGVAFKIDVSPLSEGVFIASAEPTDAEYIRGVAPGCLRLSINTCFQHFATRRGRSWIEAGIEASWGLSASAATRTNSRGAR